MPHSERSRIFSDTWIIRPWLAWQMYDKFILTEDFNLNETVPILSEFFYTKTILKISFEKKLVLKTMKTVAVLTFYWIFTKYRSNPAEMFLRKGVLKTSSTFTGEHPCRSTISIKLKSNFIEITLRHVCCSAIFLYIFRTLFCKKLVYRNLRFFELNKFKNDWRTQMRSVDNLKHLINFLRC